jgi:hypothetical protein
MERSNPLFAVGDVDLLSLSNRSVIHRVIRNLSLRGRPLLVDCLRRSAFPPYSAIIWAYPITGSAGGKVSGNFFYNYQKGGIVANGPGVAIIVSDNQVVGQGAVAYIAQNSIQIGYGASASVMKNTVFGHSYTGTSTVSGGIIVVGGPGYGTCSGNPCALTTGTQIVQNTITDNDIGVFLTNREATPIRSTCSRTLGETNRRGGTQCCTRRDADACAHFGRPGLCRQVILTDILRTA